MRLRRPAAPIDAMDEPETLPLPEAQADPITRRPPPLRDLFFVWLRIGTLSVGGGASTLFMMRRELVQRHRWLTGDEYNEAYALSKLVPGINITAQTMLMGKMMAGARGSAVCLAGLLAPAVLLTSFFAAIITLVQGNRVAEAMLAGVVPAAGGLTFAIVAQMGGGQIGVGWERARSLGIMVICAALFGVFHRPVPLVLISAGVVGALFPRLAGIRPTTPPTPPPAAIPTTETTEGA